MEGSNEQGCMLWIWYVKSLQFEPDPAPEWGSRGRRTRRAPGLTGGGRLRRIPDPGLVAPGFVLGGPGGNCPGLGGSVECLVPTGTKVPISPPYRVESDDRPTLRSC